MPKRNINQKVNITPVHEKDYGTGPAEGVGEMGEELGTPLYTKPCWYVPPQRVGFLRRLGLKTGIDFAQGCGIG